MKLSTMVERLQDILDNVGDIDVYLKENVGPENCWDYSTLYQHQILVETADADIVLDSSREIHLGQTIVAIQA